MELNILTFGFQINYKEKIFLTTGGLNWTKIMMYNRRCNLHVGTGTEVMLHSQGFI